MQHDGRRDLQDLAEQGMLLPIHGLEQSCLLVKPRPKTLLGSLVEEIQYLSSFSLHAMTSVSKGLFNHRALAAHRKDWGLDNTLYVETVRGILQYRHHSVDRARFWAPERDLKNRGKSLNGIYSIPEETGPTAQDASYSLTGEWVTWNDKNSPPSNKVILFLHGGAYFGCNPQTHRQLTYRYARETGARVFALAYRLAPQYPFPAALHDAYAAYLYLTDPSNPAFQSQEFFNTNTPLHNAVPPERITLMGDSAGAGLAVALVAYLKYLGVPSQQHVGDAASAGLRGVIPPPPPGIPLALPSSMVLLSPWVDLTLSGASWMDNASHDIIFPLKSIWNDIHHKGSKNPTWWYVAGESAALDSRQDYFVQLANEVAKGSISTSTPSESSFSSLASTTPSGAGESTSSSLSTSSISSISSISASLGFAAAPAAESSEILTKSEDEQRLSS
ncbi:MAG: hypothetical protein SGCHY_003823, partial [Lobulomycetales sp.]